MKEKQTAVRWIDDHRPLYEEIAGFIWEHPEPGLAEFESASRLSGFLEQMGFEITRGVSGMPTAFMAEWGAGKPVVGFCAEYDALPNLSQKSGLDRPEPVVPGGAGHGCGHNLLGTSCCLAAAACKSAMEKHGIPGTVKVFGTPAEEILVGKAFMARDGVFDDTDVVISWHPYDRNEVDNKSFQALTSAKFRFLGRASHTGSAPEHGRSALDAVELMAMGMNFMKQHVVQEARINYVITNGGDYPGTVSQEAEAWYLIRAPRRFLVDRIWDWTQEVAKGAALMTQTTVHPRLITATWEVLPNKVLIGVGDANVHWLGAPDFTPEDQSFGDAMIKSLGREPKGPAFNTAVTHPDLSRTFPDVDYVRVGTDLGNVSWVVPVLHFRVATKANGTPHHTWQMVAQTASPAAFKGGLKVSQWMAASALDCLMQPEIIEQAWEEHRKSLDTHEFYHPIPSEIKTPSFEDVYGKGGSTNDRK